MSPERRKELEGRLNTITEFKNAGGGYIATSEVFNYLKNSSERSDRPPFVEEINSRLPPGSKYLATKGRLLAIEQLATDDCVPKLGLCGEYGKDRVAKTTDYLVKLFTEANQEGIENAGDFLVFVRDRLLREGVKTDHIEDAYYDLKGCDDDGLEVLSGAEDLEENEDEFCYSIPLDAMIRRIKNDGVDHRFEYRKAILERAFVEYRDALAFADIASSVLFEPGTWEELNQQNLRSVCNTTYKRFLDGIQESIRFAERFQKDTESLKFLLFLARAERSYVMGYIREMADKRVKGSESNGDPIEGKP